MKYLETLQKTINYIDEQIQNELTVNELAKHVGYSPFHFSRIFKEAVGETLMEYVTKRKLQFALRDMSKQISMNDVAFTYGYESYVGFAKAFKKVFGISPSLYRIHCPDAEPPIINLKELTLHKIGGVILQPKIVTKESFSIVGRTYEIQLTNIKATKDAPTFWYHTGLTDGEIERTLYETFKPTKHGEYCLNIADEEDWSMFTYFFGVLEEQSNQNIGQEFQRLAIPDSTYAVFSTPPVRPSEFVSSVKGTWQYILNYWFPYSNYVISESSYDFEFYDERCHPWVHDLVSMDIYIPIRKREESISS